MRLIQEIGSYAGLAAVPGLAILSALYFSQARDVRRLREWAGRAPERAAELAQGGRIVAARSPAQPAAQPESQPATQEEAATGTATAGAAAAAAAGGGGGTATAAPPRAPATPAGPPRVAPTVPAAGGGDGGRTAILGVGATQRPPWYRRVIGRLPAARYIAIVVVGIAVIGGGIAYGITQLGKDTGNGAQQGTKAPARGVQSPAAKSKSGSLKPSDVDVTVLNGTTVANLAHNFGTKLENDGFKVENQLTANRGQVAESAVLFKSGANREAQLVARKLDITQIEPADPQSASQAGAADVVVVIGSDLAH